MNREVREVNQEKKILREKKKEGVLSAQVTMAV
jgi:hypothetical protein